MKENKYEKLNLLIVFLFTLFIFSGLTKWMKIWTIDPTFMFGGLVALLLPILLFYRNQKVYKRKELGILGLFLLFSSWLLVSMSYSISPAYMYDKATRYILIIFTTIVPFLTIRYESDIMQYLFSFSAVGIAISLIILFLYWTGGLDLYETYFKLMEGGNKNAIPDYLALGAPVGISAIIFLLSKKKILRLLCLLPISTMVLLAGRGPILALIIALIFFSLFRFRLTKSILKLVFLLPVIFLFGYNSLSSWSGSERLYSRVEIAQTGDTSLTDRVLQLGMAEEMIKDKPLLGIGLGSFGLYAFNADMRAYPHNMLMEIFVEQGGIGILLFLLFFGAFGILIWKNHFFSPNYLLFIPATCLIFEMINILKSNSIIDNRLFFTLIGILIASHQFYKRKRKIIPSKNTVSL